MDEAIRDVHFLLLLGYGAFRMGSFISGIQQVGIGVTDLDTSWRWYRRHFGMDVPIFHDSADATFMVRYTGNTVHSRSAVLAINLRGGGGFEIWQFTSRTPEPAPFQVLPGDLGITAISLKTSKVSNLFAQHKEAGIVAADSASENPAGTPCYYTEDPDGNRFRIVESGASFSRTRHSCGGVTGVEIGVRSIEPALRLYADVLGYDRVVYDVQGEFDDMAGLGAGRVGRLRRVLLDQSHPGRGSFGRLFGASTIELFTSLDRKPRKLYENRFWGDCGFIHACFDARDMDALKLQSESSGFPFTVDSGGSFDMGEAEGRFAYTEDPDGTLIEVVETLKLPIIAKLNIYLDLRKRSPDKPLPDWMLKTLRFSRVK